ncbi:MAG: hypothetical protein C0433_16335 [Cyclobacterium sp.]|nr:hypothetical protein [Cyclobacterium sp.]
MATLKITLDERRTKKNGTFPVVIRITHQSKSRDITTGYTANSKTFSKATGTFRKDDAANLELFKLLELYSNKLKALRASGLEHLSVQDLKEKLLLTESTGDLTIYDFWQKEICHLRSVNRYGSATIYQNTLGVFEQLVSLKLPFETFGYKGLLELGQKLFAGNRKVNTVGVYMRTF